MEYKISFSSTEEIPLTNYRDILDTIHDNDEYVPLENRYILHLYIVFSHTMVFLSKNTSRQIIVKNILKRYNNAMFFFATKRSGTFTSEISVEKVAFSNYTHPNPTEVLMVWVGLYFLFRKSLQKECYGFYNNFQHENPFFLGW